MPKFIVERDGYLWRTYESADGIAKGPLRFITNFNPTK